MMINEDSGYTAGQFGTMSETQCLSETIEQLSKVDRQILRELIRKRKVKIRIPGGALASRDIACWNLSRSIEMCKALTLEVGWFDEGSKGSKSNDGSQERDQRVD
jgi:hypothetical protein